MLKLSGRLLPAPIVNEREGARTYLESVVRMSMTTLPNNSWRHGRTTTLTRRVSLVVLLSVREPTVPFLAVCSSAAGVTDNPPLWACAVAALPNTPAHATTIGTARRRVFRDTIREPSTTLTPGRTCSPLRSP